MLALLLALQAAPAAAPAPSEIVAAAKPAEWVTIGADNLLVMELAPDAAGKPRRVVIQLIPAPFSQGWVANIRTLAKARWWNGLSVNRVQDNYVVQWGDASEKKPLPSQLHGTPQNGYSAAIESVLRVQSMPITADNPVPARQSVDEIVASVDTEWAAKFKDAGMANYAGRDAYSHFTGFVGGWPLAGDNERLWPVHCYAMVGVGRGLSPDTGSGAELYTVIGHAPRHLDRNIAVVGRVVEGIEHMSSLPRGTEALGFYKTADERTAIRSIRLASDLPTAERPRLQYLSTESASFGAYANARANRRDAFFIRPAGGADICNVPVPVRRMP